MNKEQIWTEVQSLAKEHPSLNHPLYKGIAATCIDSLTVIYAIQAIKASVKEAISDEALQKIALEAVDKTFLTTMQLWQDMGYFQQEAVKEYGVALDKQVEQTLSILRARL